MKRSVEGISLERYAQIQGRSISGIPLEKTLKELKIDPQKWQTASKG